MQEFIQPAMQAKRWVFAFFFFIVAYPPAATSQQTPVCPAGAERGFVEDIHGVWIDHQHPRKPKDGLQRFSVICADSGLQPLESPKPGDAIKIRLTTGVIASFSCSTPTLCSAPIALKPLPENPSGFLQVLLTFMQKREPPEASIVSRGETLEDAVVGIQSGQLDLGPALRYADPGKFIVRLCRLNLNDTSTCNESQFQQTLDVDGTATAPIPAASIVPGLYQLELRDPTSQDASAGNAWVLVCSQADFPRLSTQYKSAMQEASKWSGSMPDFSRLQRLYLISLAGAR